MLIRKVEITNFRGFKDIKTFSFNDKSLILLSAQNGLGKTTIIDSIEWCLTGNIGRLKNSFDSRSTNSAERKKNLDGILKNKKAGKTEKIRVNLEIIDQEDSYIISREQTKDELDPKNSVVTINGTAHTEGDWLDKYINNNFYNFHFCDIQKSFGMQNKKRQDLPEMFTEFITDYSQQEIVADNLEIFLSDVIRKEDDCNERKKKLEIEILKSQEKLNEFQDRPNIQDYPQTILYEGEKTILEGKNEEELKLMQRFIYGCGFSHVTDMIRKKNLHQTTEMILTKLNQLKKNLAENGENINKAIELEIGQNDNYINSISNRLEENQRITITKNNISDYVDKIDSLNNSNFTKNIWNDKKSKIEELEKNVNELSNSIENLANGNILLKLLSEMVTQKPILMNYRSECMKNSDKAMCPICGSDNFGLIKETEVLAEAQTYIENNGIQVAKMTKEKEEKRDQIKKTYNELIVAAEKVLQNQIEKDQQEKNQIELLIKETCSFFDLTNSLNKLCEGKYSILDFSSLETINSIETAEKLNLLSHEDLEIINVEIDEILVLLGYTKEENESDSATIQRIELAAKDAPKIITFSKELLIGKINALNSILNDKDYIKTSEDLRKTKESIDKLNEEYELLEETKRYSEIRAKEIRDLISILKIQEYEMIGPNLYKFYKKLTRINTIKGVQVSFENDQVSLTDEEGNLVVNILSNGQLNVFMLAYFFAGIISRSKEEKFKVYFIDDLTSCMDDVNMLAFLDLMKYQLMEQNGSINQVFFASCDDRICRLLRYKLEGCEMQYREIAEIDFER